MRRLPLIVAGIAALATSGARQEPGVTAFTGVAVVPMDRERVLEDQTVVVRGGRIVEIGPSSRVRVPGDATRIDGRGRYLIPGLAELHAHIPPPANAEFQERVLVMYLAGGVTTIRGMLGNPQHLELRRRAASGEILSPTIYTSGPSFNGSTAPAPDVARRMVEEQRQAGYDFLKIHPGLTRAVFDTLASTAQRLGIAFAGHVPLDVGLERALEARYSTIDHLDGYVEFLARAERGAPAGFFGLALIDAVDTARIADAARRTREAGVWVVPTQTLFETMAGTLAPETMAAWPGTQYLPQQLVQQWIQAVRNFRQQNPDTARLARYLAVRRALIRRLHDEGVGILLGSDAPQWMNPPGFSIHRELASYVRAGLTPFQALRTGTVNVARFFGTERETGTIERGKRADLVLLEGNPLQDIGNVARIAGVMVRGRWLTVHELVGRLQVQR
ncbi:MAG TPA: amidohydrolase family protein [Gemmatimonadales bacterium]|nr:amidohydrolase family protein [Gemmatimonadales bacterium]